MTEDFNADAFVEGILNAGKYACDSSAENFEKSGQLPEYYDEEKFKRGQRFFHDNVFAMFFSKFIGLILTLSLQPVNALLKITEKTGNPSTAYRRFLKTVFHMCSWYSDDFHPGSPSWKSITKVRCVHNGASRKGLSAGLGRITQREMALGHFGFVGLAIVRPEMMGLHKYTDEELEGFVHFWRVLGHFFGVEERFNICRNNLEETKTICNILFVKIFQPEVERLDEGFVQISTAVSKGMWCMNPLVEFNVFLAYISTLFETSTLRIQLNFWRKLQLKFIAMVIASLRFTLIRKLLNVWQYFTIWIMRTAPFLAYYRFGYKNAHVHTGINIAKRT